MALCLLSKQILLTEMAIIIHGSSAGVQDKHFIRLLPPNKMTLHRQGPCLDMWIMHAVCLRTEAGGGNTALIVLLKTSWRLKCRIMVFIVKNKVWVVTGQRVCSKVTEHKKKKKTTYKAPTWALNWDMHRCRPELLYVSIFVWSPAWWWPFNPHFPEA